jgi:hypothetical protein
MGGGQPRLAALSAFRSEGGEWLPVRYDRLNFSVHSFFLQLMSTEPLAPS